MEQRITQIAPEKQPVFYKIDFSKGPKKKCCKSYKKKKGNMCKRCPKKFCVN